MEVAALFAFQTMMTLLSFFSFAYVAAAVVQFTIYFEFGMMLLDRDKQQLL